MLRVLIIVLKVVLKGDLRAEEVRAVWDLERNHADRPCAAHSGSRTELCTECRSIFCEPSTAQVLGSLGRVSITQHHAYPETGW